MGRGNVGPSELVLSGKLDWMGEGACIGEDPEMWFAQALYEPEAAKAAKKICDHCPVQVNCLKYGKDTQQEHGTWGGVEALVLLDPQRGARALRRLEARKEEWS